MKRLYPYQIRDKLYLSRLLELYVTTLQESPLELRLKALAYDTGIQESIFQRLMGLYRSPEDVDNVNAEDFHIIFRNILFRFPTVKMWLADSGEVFFEM